MSKVFTVMVMQVILILYYRFCRWYVPRCFPPIGRSAVSEETQPTHPTIRTLIITITGVIVGLSMGVIMKTHLASFVYQFQRLFQWTGSIKDTYEASFFAFSALFLFVARFPPHSKNANMRALFSFIVGAAAAVITFHFHHWLVNDVVMLAGTAVVLGVFYLVPMKMVAGISCVVMAWDIYFVYFSGTVTGVLVEAVTKMDGKLFIIPHGLSLRGDTLKVLGGGDIFFAGLMIMAAWKAGGAKAFWGTLLGCCVGLLICDLVYFLTHNAQPATIFFIPCAFTGYWIAKNMRTPRRRKVLGVIQI